MIARPRILKPQRFDEHPRLFSGVPQEFKQLGRRCQRECYKTIARFTITSRGRQHSSLLWRKEHETHVEYLLYILSKSSCGFKNKDSNFYIHTSSRQDKNIQRVTQIRKRKVKNPARSVFVNLVPRLFPLPRERPWLGMVTCHQDSRW